MKNRRNYYRILQIQPDAPPEVVRSSFRTLMREMKQHPDLGGSNWNAAILNEAFATLIDPVKRADYDRRLFELYTKRPAPAAGAKRPLISVFCPFCKRPLARKARPDQRCATCRSPLQSRSPQELSRRCRRSVDRMKRSETISYYSAWPQKPRTGRTLNLSPRGMCFLGGEPLPRGSVVKISSALLRATARVVNVREQPSEDSSRFAIGVEFLAVSFESPRSSFISVTG